MGMRSNLLVLLSGFMLMSSCVSTTTTTVTTQVADVVAYNANGTVLKEWNDVTISSKTTNTISTSTESAFKSFGLNFYDKANDKYVILSNAVPWIAEYSTSVVAIQRPVTTDTSPRQLIWVESSESLEITCMPNSDLHKVENSEIQKKEFFSNDVESIVKRFREATPFNVVYSLKNPSSNSIVAFIGHHIVSNKYYYIRVDQVVQ